MMTKTFNKTKEFLRELNYICSCFGCEDFYEYLNSRKISFREF